MAVPPAAGAVRVGGPAANVRLRDQRGWAGGRGGVGLLGHVRQWHDRYRRWCGATCHCDGGLRNAVRCGVLLCSATRRSGLWQLASMAGRVHGRAAAQLWRHL